MISWEMFVENVGPIHICIFRDFGVNFWLDIWELKPMWGWSMET